MLPCFLYHKAKGKVSLTQGNFRYSGYLNWTSKIPVKEQNFHNLLNAPVSFLRHHALHTWTADFTHSGFKISCCGFLKYKILSQTFAISNYLCSNPAFLTNISSCTRSSANCHTHTIPPRDHLIINIETQQWIFSIYYLRSSRSAFWILNPEEAPYLSNPTKSRAL